MEKVKIFTDSCSDLSPDVISRYDIKMLSTPVYFGEERYYDRDNLTPGEFYNKLENYSGVPKTSQIGPTVFESEFKKALEEGYKVLSLNFSSKLSGIFESAALAKKNIGSDDIHVIDTRCASVGFGLSVIYAARLLEEGRDLNEVIESTLDYCAHQEHIFAVGSLEMLKRGGRIKSTTAFIGNILKIKPILHFRDGEILPLGKARGKKRMFEYLLEKMEERGKDLGSQFIGLNHSANPGLANKLKDMIKEKYGVEEFYISEIGAAIGSHVGKNTVSVFFQSKDRVASPEVR
ncbi:DegV family protein [Halothermothrix orenii]|uniref:DegV family protein n=1 Tax=Halothermothrix orenii (strain H 168 / OCM 544 / DSM 9562) TaxID=373903 RepID=B8CXY8_HALOH|nr:DegV family protein [Halothermothrix orenii]ACL70157.1 degV family protein [Halothermothrix orenii H 168]